MAEMQQRINGLESMMRDKQASMMTDAQATVTYDADATQGPGEMMPQDQNDMITPQSQIDLRVTAHEVLDTTLETTNEVTIDPSRQEIPQPDIW